MDMRMMGAATLIVVAAIVTFALGGAEAALVTLVGGLAAILLAASGDETPDAQDAPALEDTAPRTEDVLSAFSDPVFVVRDRRVVQANATALALLGRHIVGEDVRVAVRNPAAVERLAAPFDAAAAPLTLDGIGAPEQRWEMRVGERPDGARIVVLADRTGSLAAERMRVDFVANASHELRTPLASILGYIETLEGEAGDVAPLRARFLKIILDQARRMQRLIDDLISLSRIEADKFRPPETEVDLAELAREVGADLSHGARGADLMLDVGADDAIVQGDAAQLSQMLHNLVGNAMKYGRHGTPVGIAIRSDGTRGVRITVTDEGDGIAAEHLPRLTERFYRADAGRSRALGGTGLGLAIVKHIVERHRGRLDIASTPGVGTRVTVTLPAHIGGAGVPHVIKP